jgi:hypothetical protein
MAGFPGPDASTADFVRAYRRSAAPTMPRMTTDLAQDLWEPPVPATTE